MTTADPGASGIRRSRATLAALPETIAERHRASGRLGPLLAWSVVFADIGTSIYYVPGLLFGELGKTTPSPAAAFVVTTGLAVILLALKYVDVAARYPDGGGVVSVASDGFGPTIGCLGGILILVSYFLTGAISSVSGWQYLAGLFPSLHTWILPGACAAIVFLGLLNVVGIQESAMLTAFLAVASFVVNVVVLGTVALQLDAHQWQLVWEQFRSVKRLEVWPFLAGFSGSWLAYSGLESISQVAPALREPRQRTALKAMMMVMGAILLTSPMATAMSTALLDASVANPETFLLELGTAFGPGSLRIAIVLTAAALLMGAANTAIIGCYHVFLALVRLGYMPRWMAYRSRMFNTPHLAIAMSVLVPVLVIVLSRANMTPLGHLYSFGLLGAFTLTSVGLDRIRWQERKRGPVFYLGFITTVLVVGAWIINLIHQYHSTLIGGSVTAFTFGIAYAIRRGWIGTPRHGVLSAEVAEAAGAELPTAVEILTVSEALEMRSIYRATTLVAMRAPNVRLFQQAAARARGREDQAVYLLFVDEVPGLFFPPKTGPSREAQDVLAASVDYFRRAGLTAIPIWRMAHDAGASIASAAKKLGVEAVMVGTSQRSAVWHLLRGNVLKSLVRDLPDSTRVWICN